MKKLVLTLGLGVASLFAAGNMNHNMDHSKMNHSMHKMNSTAGAAIMEHKMTKNYMAMISSEKPLVTGVNEIKLNLSKKGIGVNGKAKLKVFMPEMPGMPYMEFEDKANVVDGVAKFKINFTMGGTWQYQLKFKDNTGVNSVRGSLNL